MMRQRPKGETPRQREERQIAKALEYAWPVWRIRAKYRTSLARVHEIAEQLGLEIRPGDPDDWGTV
jgi:hypothetical protein